MNNINWKLPVKSGIISYVIFVILQKILHATDTQGFILISTIIICVNLWSIAVYLKKKD